MSRKIDFVKNHHLSYVFYRLKNKGFTYKQINDIVNRYQELLADDIINGKAVIFKQGLGSLKLSKIHRSIKVDESGKIINNLPIDMGRTLKFWEEHPEFKNKKYIRYINEHSNGYLFRLTFGLKRSTFKLRSFYTFRKSSTLKKMLAKNIKEGKVDAIIKEY